MNTKKSGFLKSFISAVLALIIVFCPLMAQTAAAAVIGDVNNDGKLNSTDALCVLQYSVSLITLSDEAKKLADVNNDGAINSTDALDIFLVATEQKDPFTPEEKPEEPVTVSYKATVKADPALNMRTGAGTGNSIILSIPYGTVITVTEESNGWAKTSYAGRTGWVTLQYITKNTESEPEHGEEPQEPAFESYKVKITADPSLNLRSSGSTSGSILLSIPYGKIVTITEEKNGWGKTTYSGKTGWISLTYTTKDINSESETGSGTETGTGQSGTFTITCYGFGHGVGMSQWGAITYAEQGWTYDQILLHYYPGTQILKDGNMPSTVKYGGKTIDLRTYIGGATYAETGDYVSYESIKSLMVAIYTFAKYYDFNVSGSAHVYESNTSKWKGTAVEQALNEVLGEYVAYGGKAIEAIYGSSVGGKTTSAENAWGYGPSPEYLKGGIVSPEPESVTKKVYTYSAARIKELALKNMGVNLTGDPSTWFTDIVHDKSINDTTGYISSMKVGGKTIKGTFIRTDLFQYEIRSHCLNIKYNP